MVQQIVGHEQINNGNIHGLHLVSVIAAVTVNESYIFTTVRWRQTAIDVKNAIELYNISIWYCNDTKKQSLISMINVNVSNFAHSVTNRKHDAMPLGKNCLLQRGGGGGGETQTCIQCIWQGRLLNHNNQTSRGLIRNAGILLKTKICTEKNISKQKRIGNCVKAMPHVTISSTISSTFHRRRWLLTLQR